MKNMKKFGLLCLALVLALGALGIGYAAWTDQITINGTVSTGELSWCIEDFSITPKDAGPDWTSNYTCDPATISTIRPAPELKDVGSTTAVKTDCNTLTLTVNNGYPGYYNHIDFWAINDGNIPLKIWKVVISDGTHNYPFYAFPSAKCLELGTGAEAGYDLVVKWGDSWGVQLDPREDVNFSFDFRILQPAPQNAGGVGGPSAMTFTITVTAIQWDKYVAGPLP